VTEQPHESVHHFILPSRERFSNMRLFSFYSPTRTIPSATRKPSQTPPTSVWRQCGLPTVDAIACTDVYGRQVAALQIDIGHSMVAKMPRLVSVRT